MKGNICKSKYLLMMKCVNEQCVNENMFLGLVFVSERCVRVRACVRVPVWVNGKMSVCTCSLCVCVWYLWAI